MQSNQNPAYHEEAHHWEQAFPYYCNDGEDCQDGRSLVDAHKCADVVRSHRNSLVD